MSSAVGVMARGGKKFRTVMDVGRGAFLVVGGIMHGLKLKSLGQGSQGRGKCSGLDLSQSLLAHAVYISL